MMNLEALRQADREIYGAVVGEMERQRSHIELIAAENFVSEAVLCASGSVMTNKYAEGYPGARYYGGPAAASEPETKAIMQAIQQLNPGRIIALHSISAGKHCNNYDGPGEGLAERMAAANHYPVKATIGYPTPGSFGTWAGIDKRIATVTLELPAGQDVASLWAPNKAALLAAIRDQQPALGN